MSLMPGADRDGFSRPAEMQLHLMAIYDGNNGHRHFD